MKEKEDNYNYTCKDCSAYSKHYIFFKNRFHYIYKGTCMRKRSEVLDEKSKTCPYFKKLDQIKEKELYEHDLRDCLNKIYNLLVDVSYYFDIYENKDH